MTTNNNKIHYAWFIMASCCLFAFSAIGLFFNTYGNFFVPVCEELNITRGALSFYMSILFFVMTFSQPIAGILLAKYNIRIIIAAAVVTTAVAYISLSVATSVIHWYIVGAVLGIASGFYVYILVPTLINNWFKEKAGLALGVSLSFTSIGGAVCSPLITYAITTWGWRTGYVLFGLGGLVLSLPAILFMRYSPAEMGLKPYGAREEEQQSPTVANEGISTAQAYKTPSFYLLLFVAAFFALSTKFISHIPGYLNSIGQSSMVGATVASTVMIGGTAGKFLVGMLNDKFGLKAGAAVGTLSGVVSMGLLLTENLPLIYIGAFIFGINAAMVFLQPPLLGKHIFGLKEFSTIYSRIAMAQSLIGAVSVTLFGFLFDIMQSFKAVLIIIALASFLCFIFSFAALYLGKNIKVAEK